MLLTRPILCWAGPAGWAAWLWEGWELGIPAPLPFPPLYSPPCLDPSLPSPPESARSRGRKRRLLPDGSKCSICNTLSEEIAAESLSLIKQPGQILREPAGQPHPLATGGEATGAGDVGRTVAVGCLDGEGLDWTPAAGWARCHLSGQLLCGASSCFLLPHGHARGMEVRSLPRRRRREVDVSPLVGFPNLFPFEKQRSPAQGTLWAADVLLLEAVVMRQSVRDAPNPRGWAEHPPSPCTPQAGDAVEAPGKRERARRETEAGRRVALGSERSSGMLVRVRSRV